VKSSLLEDVGLLEGFTKYLIRNSYRSCGYLVRGRIFRSLKQNTCAEHVVVHVRCPRPVLFAGAAYDAWD